ncbi:MAG: T9SS type A sorting domain-containing protein [candidate division Zixibacteria bacterium]|nr:T9SS type A sorting domain-containing protein [candidate division Zixibacteria bacterium]
MRRIFAISIAICFLFSLSSFGAEITKVKISEAQKIERLPEMNPNTSAAPGIPLRDVILDSPGVQVGTTYYDYQSNGSSGTRITRHTCGTHFLWMNGIGQWSGNRWVYYNFMDPDGNLNWPGGTQVSEVQGAGYCQLDQSSMGYAVAAFHSSANMLVTLGIDDGCGNGNFTLYDPPESVTGYNDFFWPYVAYDNGGRVHITCTENTGIAGDPQAFGHTFTSDPNTWPDLTLCNDGDDIMTVNPIVVASPVDDKVAIVFLQARTLVDPDQYNNDVCYHESLDGQTWNYADITNVTNYQMADTIRAYTDVDAVYDNNGDLHILWNTPFYDEINGTISTDACFLWHWSEATGIDMVADGWFPSFPGAWNRTISKMSIGVGTDNTLYALWTQFNDDDVSAGGYSNGELYLSSSSDGGETWADAVNLTNTPTPGCLPGDCDSDHWSSMAEMVDDQVHILYINDKDAGGIPQSEGAATENPVLYLTYDVGAVPCCDVDMTPDDDPVIVPPGGSFGLTGYIGNPTSDPIVTDVWGGVKYLGYYFNQFAFNNIPLNPGQFLSAHTSQFVPGYAPAGTYDYIAYCGDRPGVKCDSASFPFTVSGARLPNGADEWSIEGEFLGIDIPTEFRILGAFPNPFNATTTISFELPYASDVSLEIFNVLGQKVETLANGHREAGQHTITWDAANQASGVYFYKLQMGDRIFTRKVSLLK